MRSRNFLAPDVATDLATGRRSAGSSRGRLGCGGCITSHLSVRSYPVLSVQNNFREFFAMADPDVRCDGLHTPRTPRPPPAPRRPDGRGDVGRPPSAVLPFSEWFLVTSRQWFARPRKRWPPRPLSWRPLGLAQWRCSASDLPVFEWYIPLFDYFLEWYGKWYLKVVCDSFDCLWPPMV